MSRMIEGKIRFSRVEERQFVKRPGRQNVVRDTAMLVNPRLYGIQNMGPSAEDELAPLKTEVMPELIELFRRVKG